MNPVVHNSGEERWFTPKHIIDLARRVMGNIDLDPASCEQANEVVKADLFYTKEQDGLQHIWKGKVWLNPPYSRGIINKFVDKFCEEEIEGMILVNNATETKWMQNLISCCQAFCFIRGRTAFTNYLGKKSIPLQGNIIAYRGPSEYSFVTVFRDLGQCLLAL